MVGVVTTLAGVHFIGSGIIKQAQDKVRLDLNTAREVYNNRLEAIRTILEFTAIRSAVKEGVLTRDLTSLASKLDEVRKGGGLDILDVTDADGKVILRSQNPGMHGDSQTDNPIIKGVLGGRLPLQATEVIPAAELIKEGSELAKRARIGLIPTPKAEQTAETERGDGMMLCAAVPMLSDSGNLIGVIYGGDILNRDYRIVDKIKDIVYRGEKYGGRDIGTATIFQGDLRVSTNVMTGEMERAIGTRVWEEVGEQVLERGQPWVGEAFVVNNWYITAYEPIRDLENRIIGMLYVGILKKPFADARLKVVAVFLAIVLLGVASAAVAAGFLAGRITRPIRQMQKIAGAIAAGDYSREIRVKSKSEVGELADSFNSMTKKLLGVQDELTDWGEKLEEKVEARTEELRSMQNQLIQAEKMASIGRLAAGVAHEINNPLTGILTNSSLLLEEMDEGHPQYGDIKAIVDETLRCRNIVKGLLDFARQTEPAKGQSDINGVIESVLALLSNQAIFQNIKINKELSRGLPQIMIDNDQIKQVFMNIILNAAEAMPRGGEFSIGSRLEAGQVVVSFKDTGCGIDKEHIDKLFDPFFTTKEKGTGLGLSVSYGIVERHGGVIEVESEPGRGAVFTVKLPIQKL